MKVRGSRNDGREIDRLGCLGPKDPYATAAVVLAASEARPVEVALDFRAARKRAVEARQAFEVIRAVISVSRRETPHKHHITSTQPPVFDLNVRVLDYFE